MQEAQNTLEHYLTQVTKRLTDEGFDCRKDVLYNQSLFKCVARKTKFELSKFGFSEYFFLFAHLTSTEVSSLRTFSSDCFEYSIRSKKIPLPRGFFAAVWCFPVAIVGNMDARAVEVIKAENPPKHWASAEIPVVFNLRSKELYFFEKTPLWGSAYYDGFRKMIKRLLAP